MRVEFVASAGTAFDRFIDLGVDPNQTTCCSRGSREV